MAQLGKRHAHALGIFHYGGQQLIHHFDMSYIIESGIVSFLRNIIMYIGA